MIRLRDVAIAALCTFFLCPTGLADKTAATTALLRGQTSPNFGASSKTSPAAVDYTALSRMLAGVLVLREGGVSEAILALPYLSTVTLHYLNTQVYLNNHPRIMKMIQNFSDFHFYKDSADLVDKIDKQLKRKGARLGKHMTEDKDEKLASDIQDKIENTTALLKPASFDKDLEELNAYLAKFHINVQPKQIMAPTKFQNAAAAISNTISALTASISGITWSPSLISYGAVGLSATANGLSITPSLLNIAPDLLNIQFQGIYINPALLNVAPDAVTIQPQGVFVAPTLFAVAPTAVNILPQGVAVGASGFVEASTGVNVQTAGVAWAPVNHDISG
eukprot:jgi/Botrbrau1/18131/Bobra.53_1s0009.1